MSVTRGVYPDALIRRPLVPREVSMLRAVANGIPFTRIAMDHGVSYGTVKRSMDGIRGRVGATSLANLVHLAWRYGLI